MSEQMKIKNVQNETLKAGCVVQNDRGEILLVLDGERNLWEFPKGHLEKGETLKQAAHREVLEETGWEVELRERLPDMTYLGEKTGEKIRLATFRAAPLRLAGKPETSTVSIWSSVENARSLLFPNLLPLLNAVMHHL